MRTPKPVPGSLRGRPFRTADALAYGVTLHMLRGLAYRQVLRGVWVSADTKETLALRCAAVALLHPTAAFSHETALALYGAPVRQSGEVHVHVREGHPVPDRRGWVHPHAPLPAAAKLVTRQGLKLVPPELAWLQLAARRPSRVDQLVEVGDALLRRTPATPASMAKAAAAARGQRGVTAARAALPLLREGVDSPMETRTRLLFHRAGLPEPLINVDVYDGHGGWIGRPDLHWPAYHVVVEYQGDTHRTDRQQWRDDIAQREVWKDHGWVLVEVTADDLAWRPQRLVARVSERLQAGGWAGR